MIAALVLAAALGDCIDRKPMHVAPNAHAKPAISTHRLPKRRSLLKPRAIEPNCDEGAPAGIVELLIPPPELPPDYTPAPEMVATWPINEPVTHTPVDGCECFGRFIVAGDGGGAGGGLGPLHGGFPPAPAPVQPVPQPAAWLLLVAGIGLVWTRSNGTKP